MELCGEGVGLDGYMVARGILWYVGDIMALKLMKLEITCRKSPNYVACGARSMDPSTILQLLLRGMC